MTRDSGLLFRATLYMHKTKNSKCLRCYNRYDLFTAYNSQHYDCDVLPRLMLPIQSNTTSYLAS